MILHLGVIDVPYSDASYAPLSPKAAQKNFLGAPKRGSVNAPRHNTPNKTTGDVAEILENRYHIMETFFELNEDHVLGMLETSIEGALQNLYAGGPGTMSPNSQGESDIETRFKQFLSNREMDGTATPGVPTKAALRGVSHRFNHPYAKRGSRPSFIDTGLLQANFKSWIDNS